MAEYCHRCEGELPRPVAVAGLSRYSGQALEAMLFCPHCSAPQIRLPVTVMPLSIPEAGEEVGPASTGLQPPPDPKAVDWPVALYHAGLVALVGAVLALVGAVSAVVSFVGALWVMACGVIVLALYARSRPGAWVDRRTGVRVGFVSGLVMICALAVAGAGAGVVKRFVLKDMAGSDREYAEQNQQIHTWFANTLKEQGQSAEVQKEYMDAINSPEVNAPEIRAGASLAVIGFEGCMLLLLTTGSGALTGALRRRSREMLQRGGTR